MTDEISTNEVAGDAQAETPAEPATPTAQMGIKI